jgi:hypothetical protein
MKQWVNSSWFQATFHSSSTMQETQSILQRKAQNLMLMDVKARNGIN